MEGRGLYLLKLSFLIGAIADTAVAANWFLIASGANIPNIMCGLVGTGEDYQFAMYISALFMEGWAIILAWGWFRPYERKGLLLITAVLLLVSIIVEVTLYRSLLGGPAFLFGLGLRAALITKFSFSYFYSRDSRLADS
ncbi:MAG: hypothetical protein KZQ93_05835 [Candidatus Thiodiazotropha sp. (ex Monitilora ramsayi)]|nr:hypothetical protein [Candidatus Thiodiazotropha sp. (ex Monitilora ramsayi)]